tara:strand:+ start:1896 stop:2282 length:387 start_codon:yes stop_codon:yes gene_type:complete
MSGISVKLPLSTNDLDGHYALNKTFMEATKQNFKNLILTIPGERVMDPSFGAGVIELLFEQNNDHTRDEISSRIMEQVEIYMPHIIIEEIVFSSTEKIREIGSHALTIIIKYSVTPLNESDTLDIKVG